MSGPAAFGRQTCMQEETPGIWQRVAALILVFLQAACLTGRALERDRPDYCDEARQTEVRKAAATATAVFLQLETRPSDGKMAALKVMRIPLDDSRWPPGRPANPEVTSRAVGSAPFDAVVREVSHWLLPPERLIPPDAASVPILPMSEGSDRLPPRAAASGSVQVITMRRLLEHGADGADSETISPKSLAMADPVIAILLTHDDSATALIVADVHEGCEHEKGWYALTPLALTRGAALPAQLAGHLLLSGLWAE